MITHDAVFITSSSFLLIEGFLSLGRAKRFQLQTGLIDVEDSEAEKGVPHLKKRHKLTFKRLNCANGTNVFFQTA